MTSVFLCKFFNCQVTNLPPDEKGTCNPTIRVKFDKNKVFELPKKTKTLNPEWPGYVNKFKYEIKEGESLRERELIIEVIRHDKKAPDNLIGYVKTNVEVIAMGPIIHKLRLRNDNVNIKEDVGQIRFSIKMKQKKKMILHLNKLILTNKSKANYSNVNLEISIINKEGLNSISLGGQNLASGIQTLTNFTNNEIKLKEMSLKHFKHLMINLVIKNKSEIISNGFIECKKLVGNNLITEKDIKLLNDIYIDEIEMKLLNNINIAQLVNGEHNDNQIFGDLLFEDMINKLDFNYYNNVVKTSDGKEKDGNNSSDDVIKTFIAIDLGTTNSGYAYCNEKCNDIDKINIHMAWGDGYYRYKNKSSLLYDISNPSNLVPLAWGFKAINQYNNNKKNLKGGNTTGNNLLLISDFKLNIHTNTNVNNIPIKKIVSDFLKLMKKDIFEELERQNYCLVPKNVKIIVTVPAIWNDNDKDIMRQSCIEAELIDPTFPNNFSFALEPECASLPCLLYDNANIKPKTKFLVLDAGGGTIDIALYETVNPNNNINRFGIKQLSNASGGAAGGKFINDRFLLFLKQNLSLDNFNKIINSSDFNDLMSRWEEAKLQFKKENIEDDIFISLPPLINTIIKNIKDLDDYYEDEEGDLIIPGELFYEIYKAPVERTIEYVKEQLNKLTNPIDYIFLVGGFAESSILFNAISENFGNNNKTKIIKTPQPGIRILQGACWFGKNPNIISSRCSSLTYIAKLSNTNVKFTDAGIPLTTSYLIMARAGDIIEVSKKYKLELELKSSGGQIEIYATSLPKIKTIGPPDCNRLLSINLTKKLSDNPKENEQGLRLDVYIMFGDTELKFEVINPKTNKKIASSDFVKFDNTPNSNSNSNNSTTNNNNTTKDSLKDNKKPTHQNTTPQLFSGSNGDSNFSSRTILTLDSRSSAKPKAKRRATTRVNSISTKELNNSN